MTGGGSIENDLVDLFNVWLDFRKRLARQQGGHRVGVSQSLLPLLVEIAQEVLLGFDGKELHAALQTEGKLGLWLKRKNVGMKGFVQLAGEAATLDEATAEFGGSPGDVVTEGSLSQVLPEELPVQPVFRETDGRLRFTANEFVRWMFEEGKRRGVYTMESLAILGYPDDHFAQFLQLIGYSVSGFEEHSLVNEHAWERVEAELERLGLTAEGA